MTRFDGQRLTESVELLEGRRPGSKAKAAVRIEDLVGLMQLVEVKTQTLTAAPTMDDFNALLNDVREISRRLNVVVKALQKRQLP